MPCKTIKYKRRKSVGIKKPPKKPCNPSISISDDYTEPNFQPLFYLGGEGEYDEPYEPEIRESKKSALELLKDWVKTQRFIPQDLRDSFLLLFLTAEGYMVDAATTKLRKYFYSRQQPSMLFRNRDPMSPENQEIFKKLYVLPLPQTTYDGCPIILTGLYGPAKYDQMEHVKALAMAIDLLIWENDFGYGDFVVIIDGTHFRCPQMLENKVRNHRSITCLLLETIPGTLRSLYLLNPPSYTENVANTRDGIWFTVANSTEELIKHIPADILPVEYGGRFSNLKQLTDTWQRHMMKNRNFFVSFERRMINDYRRRICHVREVLEGGPNWIHRMKLEEDEWDYKIWYYQRMKEHKLMKHPAFGSRRLCHRKPRHEWKDPFAKCRKLAKAEEEEELMWSNTELFIPKIFQVKSETQLGNLENCEPVLELYVHYF